MDALPGPVVAPGAKISPDGRPGREVMRQGAPLASGPIQIQDGVDYFAHIGGAGVSTGLGRRNQRFENSPLLVAHITGVARSSHAPPLLASVCSGSPFFLSVILPLSTQALIRICAPDG